MMITRHFDKQQSIQARCGSNTQLILENIANHYMGTHPANSFTWRLYSRQGCKQMADARYDLNLGEKFPEAKNGQFGYAFTQIWSDTERIVESALSCYGPASLYVNGQLLYKSVTIDELNPANKRHLKIPLSSGWTTIFIKLRKTPAGFGCILGTIRSKWSTPPALAPFNEREGQAGWIYSVPTDEDVYKNRALPALGQSELATGIEWRPTLKWNTEQNKQPVFTRMFGNGAQEGQYAYGWTRLRCSSPGKQRYSFRGTNQSAALTVWIDGKEVFHAQALQPIHFDIDLTYGQHDLLVQSLSGGKDWGFNVDIHQNGQLCEVELPHPVQGTEERWLYAGPFQREKAYTPAELQTMYTVWEPENGGLYWRLDQPDAWVRPYLENANYARWNYPLGVTLYGLLQGGKMLGREDIVRYVTNHISECTRLYDYGLWDRKQYGFPWVNHQLIELDMLDDCGSFGSVMLEAYTEHKERTYLEVAEVIGDFICNRQERREDGAFYRESPGYYMEKTLWGDDLYMSTPFMKRYYLLTGNVAVLDDAAEQFIAYKKYLYMPELKVMSHVYDFKFNTATYVPWGRGNGWPLFSLSELLEVLPSTHARRGELVAFFQEFSEGLLSLQGNNGLWHQVLTDPDSYEETSCTAMFIYAFCRGLRLGILQDNRSAFEASIRQAWHGLISRAVDQYGNVHGVCTGSKYAFTADYYKDELPWKTNDTHGIGIVMLAGIEVERLNHYMANGE
ncbi:glycoside hydrolase family 88 protein [Paenibacillus qinlingensis]|uniref:Rhamnogalacturonyl hydrolase YesR n=1 Tax=Paenibacillus qinlingensis TaxID=1837343 RepID=A0ABU1P0B1_9BACL|nr:glycoside hydrolase family 88 protein [Paenibacillus qinlingensis]MDR6553179.1 rhamnogalacturonyl hydrolase YesR [Paenibacillus qinlingensis]